VFVKILLAADGSKYTRKAVNYLIKHLDMFGARADIHLLNVHPPLPGRAAKALSRAIVSRYYREGAKQALAAAGRFLKMRRIKFKEVHIVGDPGTSIASYAKKGRFSLVIMGSHGQGALKNLLLGSVANKVLSNCSVPTLIVR